jgi:hypoxanthine phosphoribosyltransferase
LPSSIYAEGLHLRADTWTVYPGSSGGGPNKQMGFVIDAIVKQFRDRYVERLLVRHTAALDSGETRNRGGNVDFANQVNTVHVNPDERKRVLNKTVLVVDDFETQGWSAECARNLLLQASAREVMCVNIGKYPKTRYVASTALFHRRQPSTTT